MFPRDANTGDGLEAAVQVQDTLAVSSRHQGPLGVDQPVIARLRPVPR